MHIHMRHRQQEEQLRNEVEQVRLESSLDDLDSVKISIMVLMFSSPYIKSTMNPLTILLNEFRVTDSRNDKTDLQEYQATYTG